MDIADPLQNIYCVRFVVFSCITFYQVLKKIVLDPNGTNVDNIIVSMWYNQQWQQDMVCADICVMENMLNMDTVNNSNNI